MLKEEHLKINEGLVNNLLQQQQQQQQKKTKNKNQKHMNVCAGEALFSFYSFIIYMDVWGITTGSHMF